MFRKRPPSVAKASASSASAAQPSNRKFFRAAVAMPANYAVVGRTGSRVCTIRDISGGGLRLENEEDLPLGTPMDVRFVLGAKQVACRARGRIVLSFFNAAERRYAHGIAFTGIEAADREAIVAYITELQREKLRGRIAD